TLHALVEPFSGNWYTQAKKETTTSIVRPLAEEKRLGLELSFGELEVTEQVVAYERRTGSGQERRGPGPPDPPPATFRTRAVRSPGSSRGSRRCRSCSRRCTPRSTP